MFSGKTLCRVLAITLLLLSAGRVRSEEAVLRNGRRIEGKLQLGTDGRLQFTPKESKNNLSFSDILDVRFPNVVPHSSLWGAPLRFGLGRTEWITGELAQLDAKTATARTQWSENVKFPRAALLAIKQLPGWLTVFHEDFDADAVRLKLTGSPTLDDTEHTSGGRSLRLDAAGQSALYALPTPLEAGRFGINFRDVGEPAGGRWQLEAEFGTKQSVRILLVEGADYSVQSKIGSGETRKLQRSPGWHRLSVRFRAEYFLVGIDDKLLFESGKKWQSEGLSSIRLACTAKPENAPMRGAVCFDDFTIAHSIEELHHDNGDLSQDECWLASGDQLFGQVSHADGKGVEIGGRFGKRTLPWSSLRVLFPKAEAIAPQTSDGAHVRIWLDSGFPLADELEGVLLTLDDRKLVLRHAIFGDLTLERSRLRRLRPLFFGKRIELDSARHHLGATGQVVLGYFPPRAEGPKLRCTFRLDSVPTAARLVITAQHLKGQAGARNRGELATEVLVNGRSLGNLNSRIDRALKDPLSIRIEIPKEALLGGENIVELIQKPEAKTGRRESCIISAVAIELPR
jgi:hypothetical protein